jgi:hypothetical protein
MPILREFDASSLMKFACGFDSIAGEVKGTAVTGEVPQEFIGGTVSNFAWSRVESVEDFLKTLDISASIDLQMSFGKGGAKAKFASSLKMHDYSLYSVASLTVKKGTRQIDNPTLKSSAASLLLQDGEQFRKTFGDTYLAGITSGGEIVAFLEIQTSSRSEFQEASAAIHGSDVSGANNGEASFRTVLNRIKSTFQMNVRILQRGGGDLLPSITPEELLKTVFDFPSKLNSDNTFEYIATFQSYNILERPAGANPIDIQHQQDVIERLGLKRIQYLHALASVEFVLNNPDQFESPDINALKAHRDEMQSAIDAVAQAASTCFSNSATCTIPPNLPAPQPSLPGRRDATLIGAIKVLRNTASQSVQHATDCRTRLETLSNLSRSVAPGPSGKGDAERASLLLSEIQTSAMLALHAGADAKGLADLYRDSPEAQHWAEVALEASTRAQDQLAATDGVVKLIHAIGYAPYWTAPTTLCLRKDSSEGVGPHILGWISNFLYTFLPTNPPPGNKNKTGVISDMAVDPLGGELDIALPCANPKNSMNMSACAIDGSAPPFFYDGGGDHDPGVQTGILLQDIDFQQHPSRRMWFGVADFTLPSDSFEGKSFATSLVIRSKKSGLATIVPIKLVCVIDHFPPGDYLDSNLQIVNNHSVRRMTHGRPNSSIGTAIGWQSKSVKQLQAEAFPELS